MKKSTVCAAALLCLTTMYHGAFAQIAQEARPVSAKKAFGLSLLLPGLGHRYAQGGSWKGSATAYAIADAALWAGLSSSAWREGALSDDYRTLAASRAGANVNGRERAFFLSMASYRSAEEMEEVLLRLRDWGRLDYARDPANFWKWSSEDDYVRYRKMREDAEGYRRRVPAFAALLVGNRLLAGLTAARSAGKQNARLTTDVGLRPNARYGIVPRVHLSYHW